MTGPAGPRVLLLLGRSTGGIGTHVDDLARHLSEVGTNVRIATDDLTAERFGWSDALRLWPAGGPRVDTGRRLAVLRAWCRRADVVHAHGQQPAILAAAVLGLRRGQHRHARCGAPSGPALVASLHNEPPALFGPIAAVARNALGRALARADLVTGASADLVDLARRLGATRTELAPVPSPRVPSLLAAGEAARAEARVGIRSELGLDTTTALVATISRIAPQKDLATLVAAAGLVRSPIAWVVAGSGDADLLDRLRARVAAENAPVRFLGPVADPGRMLLAADAFALTSHWEARALVVQEAMAAGTPVVVPAVGGLPDLASGAGRLVPPGDPRALAAAIDALLADPEATGALATVARQRAAGWPDAAATARRWARVYADLARVTYS